MSKPRVQMVCKSPPRTFLFEMFFFVFCFSRNNYRMHHEQISTIYVPHTTVINNCLYKHAYSVYRRLNRNVETSMDSECIAMNKRDASL